MTKAGGLDVERSDNSDLGSGKGNSFDRRRKERSREQLLCQWAIEEGFDRAGIARLDPSEREPEYRQWLARGDHGAMHYLGRRVEVRLDPSSRLEGSRTALCVALHYADRTGEENDLWCGVARYAQGDDYHDVMMRRLRRLGDRIEVAFPGCRSRSYVDTGPILERELGQRAGLGSIGKNTMLLHRTGSYFLLGEVLLTLDLDPSSTLPDLCGQCTRCLDACPTGALTGPYTLDARRCISYWTIEHRGEFSDQVAGDLHGWTFGCDICQEVCPWNLPSNPRRSPPADADELILPDHRGGLDLVQLATVSRQQYTERFRRSAMKRAKLDGLQRNAVAALGHRVLAVVTVPAVADFYPPELDGRMNNPRESKSTRVKTAALTTWNLKTARELSHALEGLSAAFHGEGTYTKLAVGQALAALIPEVVESDHFSLAAEERTALHEWLTRRSENDVDPPPMDETLYWLKVLLAACRRRFAGRADDQSEADS